MAMAETMPDMIFIAVCVSTLVLMVAVVTDAVVRTTPWPKQPLLSVACVADTATPRTVAETATV